MAYFPNGTSGEVFVAQCLRCRFGLDYCPIAFVQHNYNYDAVNNETATTILDELVKADGTCSMWKLDPELFGTNGESQPDLLEVESNV